LFFHDCLKLRFFVYFYTVRFLGGVTAGEDILLFGSPAATHSLIQLNLIDGYWLFVNPIILGRGIPLFVDIKDKIKLKLLTTRQFTCGVTELNYTVDRQ
jgi:dihydrofolate reductase